MNHYIVNKDSSLIALNTQALQGASSAIVYVSTTTEIGQVITIRDIDGFISSPQSIIVSTVDCSITARPSQIILQQRFSYITLKSVSTNIWTIINESMFSEDLGDYLIRGVNTLTGTIQDIVNCRGSVTSGNAIEGTSIYIYSTLSSSAPLFVNSLGVATSVDVPSSINIVGSLINSGDMQINGSFSTTGVVSLFNSLRVISTLSTIGNITVGNGLQTNATYFEVVGAISTGYQLTVLDTLAIGGFVSISTSATVNRATTVTNLFGRAVQATGTTVSSLYLSPNSYHASRTDISVVDPTYTGLTTPVLEIQQGLAALTTVADWLTTSNIATNSVGVQSVISAATLSSLVLTNASIQNRNGSLIISSIATGSFTFSTLNGPTGVQLKNVSGANFTTSNAYIQHNAACSQIQTVNTYSDVIGAEIINTSSLNLGNTQLNSAALTLSTIFISSGVVGTNISSIQLPYGTILNSAGSLQTSSTFCTTATVSTISQFYEINSGNQPTLSILGNPVQVIAPLTISTLNTYSGNAQFIQGVNMTFGTAPAFSTLTPGGLYLIPSTVQGYTGSNVYEYVSGIGTTFSPVLCKASFNRTVYMNLGNISSFSTSYINASMNYRNDGGTNGSAGFRIRNSNTFSTLITFNANPVRGLQTVTLSNYPLERSFNSLATPYYFDNAFTPPLANDSPNILVGVGTASGSSIIQYSSDSGVTWMSPPNFVFTTKASGIAWNGEKWLALGQGTHSIAYSYTGLIWYGAGTSVFTGEGLCAVWNGSIWLAGGSGVNTLAISYDGITWIGQGSDIFSVQTNGIAWNGLMFVAVGEGSNTMAYSYNGTAWNIVYPFIFSVKGSGIAWGQNIWVAVGQGLTTLAYSYDGIIWTPVSTFMTGGGLCIAYSSSNSQWVAGGDGTYPLIYSSTGTIWSPVSVLPMPTVRGIVWSTQWVLTGSSGRFATSTNGINWTLSAGTQFSGTGLAIASNTLIEAQPILYTTGDNYTLAYSVGGVRWNTVQALISGVASCILWNGSMWLATMLSGNDNILYSYDGIIWIGLGQTVFGTHANGLAWNGYIWVAVGDAGPNTIGYSYDGLSWTGLGTSIFSEEGLGVAWGAGLFVATGSGGEVFASSVDGLNWTGSGSTLFTAGAKVAYGDGVWVSVGSAARAIVYSYNGTTWFAATTQPFAIYGFDVAWNGSLWIAVGGGGGPTGTNVAYSSNGSTWTGINVPNVSALGITWSQNSWFITGATGSDSIVYTSANGINWTPASSTAYGPAYTIVSKQLYPYGTIANNLSIACGSGTSSLAISPDGASWLPLVNPLVTAYCVSWNGFQWVAGGSGSESPIAYSSDGLTWTLGTITYLTTIRAIAYNSGKWILVGSGANVWADSTDGINWTSRPVTQNGFFSGPAYDIIGGVGGFMAAGVGGLITSADGVTWTTVSTVFTTAYSIKTNGKQFVATGEGSHSLAVSYDGVTWTGLGTSIFSIKGLGLAYGLTTWVAVGEDSTNTIAVSTDGLTWTGLGKSIFSITGTSVFWNGTRFVATGQGINTVAYSIDGFNWTGLQSTVLTTGLGVGGKAIIPLQRYSLREPRQYTWRVAGGGAALGQTLVRKFSNTSAWDSAIYTAEGLTSSAYLTFTPVSTSIRCMVGLSETPGTGTTATQLNYAISLNMGLVEIYQVGFLVQTFSNYTDGDTFTILYTGSAVQYYMNDILLLRVSRAVGAPLYMSCILYTPGTLIKDIDFHLMYKITSVQPALSTAAFVASTTPGLTTSFAAPFYLTLTSDLIPSVWTLNVSAGGNLSAFSTSLYADVYINSTKYWSTNVISNIYLTSSSTYSLSFNIENAYMYSTGDTLNFRIKGSRSSGDAYIYTNWINSSATSTLSSAVVNTQANPNAVEYLEFFHNSANTGLQSSELTVYLSPISTNILTYIDSNVGLQMNTSFVRWNNALNGVTVQNRYNDIQTRSLLYTGGLYNASDPALKHSVEYVDPTLYMTAIGDLPLKRFSYIDEYISKYRTVDTTQLGVLTSDLEQQFPSLVRDAPCEVKGLSTIKTVDRGQLAYAHLAATQALILRVSSLRAKVTALKAT